MNILLEWWIYAPAAIAVCGYVWWMSIRHSRITDYGALLEQISAADNRAADLLFDLRSGKELSSKDKAWILRKVRVG